MLMISVSVRGPKTATDAKVSSRGQLITAPLEFSEPQPSVQVDVINTAFNLQVPKAKKLFVLVDLIISTDKNVNINGAIVEVYQATAIDTTTTEKGLVVLNMNRQDKSEMIGLNWVIDEGRWLNIKSDEANVDVTVAGYYVDA